MRARSWSVDSNRWNSAVPTVGRVEEAGQRPATGPARPLPPVVAQVGTQRSEDLHPRPQAGRAGTVPAHTDRRERAPRLATSRISSASRVLPTPGSPETSTSRPIPANASSRTRRQPTQRLLAADEGRVPTPSLSPVAGLAGARSDLAPIGDKSSLTRKVMHMILSAYHFDGDPDTLMECHRRMMELFPPSGLDLHIAVTHDRGLTVYDSCPDLATHQAFVASPEFRGAIAQVGLPDADDRGTGRGPLRPLNQSVLR